MGFKTIGSASKAEVTAARPALLQAEKGRHLGADCDVCPLRDLPTYMPPHLPGRDILVVGEAPGKNEVGRGPYRGRAGKQLIRMWSDAGLGELFDAADITNTVLCRPSTQDVGNEKPPKEAIAACSGHLKRLIDGHPVIVATGAFAKTAVLGDDKMTMKEARLGPPREVDGKKVIVTWHPSAVLRTPNLERDVVNDLGKVHAEIRDYKEPEVRIYDTVGEARVVLFRLADNEGPIAVDIETADAPRQALNLPRRLRAVQIVEEPDVAHVFGESVLKNEIVRAAMENLFARRRIIAHNGQFDIPTLRYLGFTVPRLGGDTLLAAYLLDSRRGQLRNLEHLSRDLLGAPEWKWLAHMKTHLYKQREQMKQLSSPPPPPFGDLTQEQWTELIEPGGSLRSYTKRNDYPQLKEAVTQGRQDYRNRVKAAEDIERVYTQLLAPYGITRAEYHAVLNTRKGTIYDVAPNRPLYIYGGYDAVNTFRLAQLLEPQLRENGMWGAYEMVLKFSDMLGTAQQRGLKPDLSRMETVRAQLQEEIDAIVAELAALGIEKPGSPQKVLAWFNDQGLELESSDKEALEPLSEQEDEVGEAARLLLKWRPATRTIGTYIDNITTPTKKKSALLNPRTGRVHGGFKIFGPETGRTSSSDPNFQNQPKKVRYLYVPGVGYVFVQGDLKAAEFYILVAESKDPTAIDLLAAGEDMPLWLGQQVFGLDWRRRYEYLDAKPLHERTADEKVEYEILYYQRRSMKTVLYGGWYGRQAPAVAREIKSDERFAQEILTTMFKSFPGMVGWQRKIADLVTRGEEIRTFFGRRYPYARGTSGYMLEKTIRGAWSAVPQGTASDILLLSAYKMHEKDYRFLIPVHDSALFEVEPENASQCMTDFEQAVEATGREYTDLVTFRTETKVGNDWYEVS